VDFLPGGGTRPVVLICSTSLYAITTMAPHWLITVAREGIAAPIRNSLGYR
jgi:hypothetical protein